jgi:hypothetical protein
MIEMLNVAFLVVTVLAVVLLGALLWDLWDYLKESQDD